MSFFNSCLYCSFLLSIIVSTLLFLSFQNDYYNRPNAPNTIPLRWLAPEGLVIQEDGVLVSKPPSSKGNVWWVVIDKQVPFLSWAQGTRTVAKTFLKKWIHAVSNFVALIPYRSICQMLVDFSTLVFTSSSKDEIRKFHVVVVQRGQINLHRRDSFVLLIQTYCLFCFLPFLPFLLPSSLFVKLPWLVKLYATAAKMRIIFWGIVSWTNQGYICHKFIHGKPTLVTICSQKPS